MTIRGPSRALTLIELLLVVAVLTLLMALLLPALTAAREQARAAVCRHNLRESLIACRMYAQENNGWGPAIGQPYNRLPNWAFVVQRVAGRQAADPGGVYTRRSVLACPTIRARLGNNLDRTYAMNATGYAGRPGDAGDYDDPLRSAHIRFEGGAHPADWPVLLDSNRLPPAPELPPATRTSSVLDLRNAEHRERRLGWFHGPGGRRLNYAALGGAVYGLTALPETWQR